MVIDVDKFVASLIKYYCEAYFVDRASIRCWFDDVLEDQGLEYKDGDIVKTQRRVAAEAKEALYTAEVETGDGGIKAVVTKEVSIKSEDEESKRWILEYLYDGLRKSDEQFKGQFKAAIAWLEKQGHPINYKEAEKACLEYRKFREECGIKDPVMLDEIEEAYYEGATSRKPVDWSEEDEYMLNETIQHLEELIRIDKAKHLGCDVQYYQRDIDWLKSIKERMGGK